MGYGRVTGNTLRKFTAKSKRKRTNNATKVRYQRPTARNQQKQIMANARVINRLNKAVFGSRVYCDWRNLGNMFAIPDAAGGISRTWFCIPLTGVSAWSACLRADQNVAVASTTYVRNIRLNLRMALQQSNYAFVNIWVVTPRKDQSARDSVAAIGAGTYPIANIDYVEGATGANLTLNSAIWKVHYCKYRTMTETSLGEAAPSPPFPAGNPDTTWGKCQVNIPCKMKIRNPTSATPWTQLPYMQLPYYQRYELLVQVLEQSPAGTGANLSARVDWDFIATTINDS